jgi:hypothetical protein
MVQKLVQHGDRLALILDDEMVEALLATTETPVQVIVKGHALLVAPANEEVSDQELDEVLEGVNRDFGRALKRLAE